MKLHGKPRLIAACLTVCGFIGPMLLAAPAARADDTDLKYDARIEGYGNNAGLDTGSAPYYILFGGLTVLGLSVLFKDAKRSHLD